MSEERGSNGLGTVIIAGAIGAAVGAVVALLLAPRPGKETRADWGEKARDFVSKAKGKAEEVCAGIRRLEERVEEDECCDDPKADSPDTPA